MATVLAAAAFTALALLAAACSSGGTAAPTPRAAPTTTASASRPSPTAVVFPTAPASADQPVWDFVRHWQGADISPILRPSFLPQGLDRVTIGQLPNKHDTSLLDVEYTGSGKRLAILAGALNPSSEGTPPTQLTIPGGVPATLATGIAADGASFIALWWQEPGEQVIQNGGPETHQLYELLAEGLAQQDIVQVANSLAPIAP